MLRLATLALLCLGTIANAADAPHFEATGRAPISGGDRVRARQRALDEAFGHAIEGALSATLGADVLVRRAADLRLKILPKAKTYVMSYRVVDEGEVEAGMFDVHISCELAVDRLVRELSDKPRDPKGVPLPAAGGRALLCYASDLGTPPRLDAALRAMLGAHALEPVPTMGCGSDELSRATRRAAARVALVAEISGQPPAPIRGTSLVGREGKLTLRLFEPDGRRSAEGDGDAAGFATNAALAADDLAMRAFGEASRPIEEALSSLGGGPRGVITARLVGVRRLAQLSQLRAALERISGVDGVEPRRFLPGSPGAIELQVRTAQPARALVAAMARIAATNQIRAREEGGVVVIEALEPVEPSPAEMPPQ
jgi:hypothetical protein